MKLQSVKRLAVAVVVTFLVARPVGQLAEAAAASLSPDQQSAAKSALCSAIASRFPNPAAAGPSALSDPGVLSTAASPFAGSTHLPLPSATDMIKAYAMQHASDIFGFMCCRKRDERRNPANTGCERLTFDSEVTLKSAAARTVGTIHTVGPDGGQILLQPVNNLGSP